MANKKGAVKDGNTAFETSEPWDVEMQYIYTFAEKKMLGAFCSLQCLSFPWMNDVYLSTLPSDQRDNWGKKNIFFFLTLRAEESNSLLKKKRWVS